MDNEIESLWLSLGIKPDDPSASDAVDKILKTVQSKLKSSIYGGKDGVITLPATIEGKFKNGREIDKSITDAYAAIYEKAKKMADESVSLTLKDIEDFKAQIDKFGKKTSKYKSSDIISNANNNLRQMLSTYQDYVNELRIEVSKTQKAQTKQAQKTKAQAKAKTRKSSYSDISDKEINDAIAKENARQKKIQAWRNKQAEQLASKLGYKSDSGIDASKTNSYSMNASEFSEYESQWARELAKTIKETYKTTIDKQWIDKEYKPKTGAKSRATSREEHLNFLSNAAFGDLADLIHKSEQGDEDATFDKIVEAIGVLRTIMEENGKDMATIAQTVINATQSRYDDNPRRKNAGVNREEGTEKGVGKGHERTQAYQASIQQLLKKMLGEVGTIKQKEIEANKTAVKMTSAYEQAKSNAKTSKASADTKALAQELKGEKSRDEKSYIQAVRESSREAAADTAEAQKNQQLIDETINNASTGTDSEAGKNEVIKAIKETKKGKTEFPAEQVKNVLANLGQTKQTDGKCPCQAILEGIRDAVQSINSKIQGKVGKAPTKRYAKKKETPDTTVYDAIKKALSPAQPALASANQPLLPAPKPVPVEGTFKNYYEGKDIVKNQKRQKEIEAERRKEQYKDSYTKETERLPDQNKITKAFADVVDRMFPSGSAVDKIMNATAEEQAKMRAERIKQYGLNRGRDLTDTGDVAQIRRTKELFGWNYGSDKTNKNLFQNVKLTPHVDIDSKAIMASLNKVLSGSEMFKAQTGGVWRNILGSMTGYIGMPSLEKSRAEAEGLNQVMANVRNEVLKLVQEIQSKELTLHGMEENGEAKFTSDGYITDTSSSASKKLFTDLEEQKGVLRGVLAEVSMVDQVVGQTGGKVHDIIKNLGFVMPELMQNNTIIKNINDGLDKNGKALKFQTRTAEILNYSFQLMARSIGQMIKNWIAMLNPLSLIKRAFQDFASYDVKWQRTMNVIKYNLRRIVRPFMEWIAQQLVNIIGLVNALMKGIGKAFGKNWDLFDQSAANAEKMREELEQAANVSAGFDELHDIGTDASSDPAMDLMGDIYTPQWGDLYETLIEKAKAATEKLAPIFKKIGDIFKWCLDNWKLLVGAWVAFKIAKALWNLLDWAKSLKDVFGGLASLPWSTIAKGLAAVAGAASVAYAGYNSYKLAKNWDQMDDGEKNDKMAKSIGFGAIGGGLLGGVIGSLLGPGGTAAGAAIGASLGTAIFGGIDAAIAAYNGDDIRREIAGTIGGAGLGALIGTAILPGIGTAVGAAVGGIVSFLGEKLTTNLFSNGGAFSNLKISQEDLAWATEQTTKAQQAQNDELLKLKQMEEQVGQSGEYLYDLVDSGTLSYENMTSTQIALVEQYKKYKDASDAVAEALKVQTDYTLAIEKENAHATGSFDTLVQGMIKAKDDGIYTEEELRDRLAQVYGEIENDQRETFLNTLPEYMRQSVEEQGQQYISNWDKFKLDVSKKWEDFKTGWGDFWTGVGTKASEAWEGMKTLAGNVWQSIKIDASDAWEGIKNSAIGQKVQEIVTNVSEKWNDMKTNAGEAWENIKTIAGQKWEDIKNSAIGQKVQGIWTNVTTKFNDIKETLNKKWDEIKNGASTGWQNIWNAITGWANNLWESITGVFDGIKEAAERTWERVTNFFSGKGFKTNEQVSANGSAYMSIATYATGTNYVPSDGLAYLHQGEAVIPKKYNQPYQQGVSNEERIYIQQLMSLMKSLDGTMKQGIKVNGQFVQRGSDLVAVVNKTKSQTGADLLSNVSYAR